jgi:hypothetical protein
MVVSILLKGKKVVGWMRVVVAPSSARSLFLHAIKEEKKIDLYLRRVCPRVADTCYRGGRWSSLSCLLLELLLLLVGSFYLYFGENVFV